MFYKKVINIEQWGDTPFFYTNMVLALFQTFIINTVYENYLLYSKKGEIILTFKPYALVFFIIGMLLYLANRAYFFHKEKRILKELDHTSSLKKIIIYLIVITVLFIIAYGFFHTSVLIRENNDKIL